MKLGLALLLVFVACSGEPSSNPSGSASANAAASTPPSSSGSAGATADSGARPPAGLYDLTVATRSSTCGEVGAAPTGAFFVQSRPKDGKQMASLPVSPMGRPAQERVDIVLEPGTIQKLTSKPARDCEYAIDREIEVTEVTSDRIAVVVRSDYGKSEGCSPARTPASCKHEATMTFALKEKFCEPDCVAEVRAGSQDGIEKTGCRCPKQ